MELWDGEEGGLGTRLEIGGCGFGVVVVVGGSFGLVGAEMCCWMSCCSVRVCVLATCGVVFKGG